MEGDNADRLKVLGYVERIDELFRITDCMITKPGGITLTEATAIGVPVILYKPVPGQEKKMPFSLKIAVRLSWSTATKKF